MHTPHTRRARWLLAALLAAGLISGSALAAGAPLIIKEWVINPSALSTGAGYTLNGVIGQSVTARASVGPYVINGGYRVGDSPTPTPTPTQTPTVTPTPTQTPTGVKLTLNGSHWPSAPFSAQIAVSAMPATAVGNAKGRSTSASTTRLKGKV